MTDIAANPYLEGRYGPVAEECTTTDLRVHGELPKELNGRYLRNGPNPISSPADPDKHHWFLGDGMVHGVRLQEGRAEWYRNRYVGSSRISDHRGVADIDGANWNNSGIGPNTNVGGFASRTWAMVEAGTVPVELTYELETIGRNDFDGTLPRGFTAHPKFDPDTGDMHAMTYAYPQHLDTVQYVVVAPDGLVKHTVDIPVASMTMVHDMSLTETWAIVLDQPVTVNFDAIGAGHSFPFRWNPDSGHRAGLLPRNGTAEDVIWIDLPNRASFHPMNAFDRPDGTVVIDICVFERMFDGDVLGPFFEGALPWLERWELNPVTRTASITTIDERPNEFPRHRFDRTGKPYRYGYTTSLDADPGSAWPTIKHDLETGTRTQFDHGAGRAAGEPVFVAREGSTDEDDGWLMMLVHTDDTADLVILDAQDLGRGEVARVELPQRIPFGFHGNWVSDRSVPPPA